MSGGPWRKKGIGVITASFLLVVSINQLAEASGPELDFKHGLSYLHELKYPEDFQHFDYLNPSAPKGGKLVLPSMPYDRGYSTVVPVAFETPGVLRAYDHLIKRSGDELSAYYGSLAESLAIDPGRRKVWFRLRPEARWHDGVPITSTDVKFTFEVLMGDEIIVSIWRSLLLWVDHIEIISEREFVIHTKSEPGLQLVLLEYMSILPAHYWSGKDPTEPTLIPPLSSGPYRIAAVKKGRMIRYERVPNYWGRNLAVNRGRFNFDTIRYDVYRDDTIAREALRKGLFDMWTESDLRHWVSSYDIPARDRGWLVLDSLIAGAERGSRLHLVLNTLRRPFDDPRVREALAHALDFDWLNRSLHSGEMSRSNSYFENTVFSASGIPTGAELALLEPFRDQLPARLFSEAFAFDTTDGVGVNRTGLLKAKLLLDEAGWHVQENVLINARGEPFTIEFLSVSSADQRILLPYANALSTLGISANIRLIDRVHYHNRLRDREFDSTLYEGNMGVPPGYELNRYHSKSINQAYPYNIAAIRHPAVDSLVDAAMVASTLDEMVNACRALDRVLLWGYYQLPLDSLGKQRIVFWDKFGWPEDLPDELYVFPYPDGWWFDAEKAARIVIDQQPEAGEKLQRKPGEAL